MCQDPRPRVHADRIARLRLHRPPPPPPMASSCPPRHGSATHSLGVPATVPPAPRDGARRTRRPRRRLRTRFGGNPCAVWIRLAMSGYLSDIQTPEELLTGGVRHHVHDACCAYSTLPAHDDCCHRHTALAATTVRRNDETNEQLPVARGNEKSRAENAGRSTASRTRDPTHGAFRSE